MNSPLVLARVEQSAATALAQVVPQPDDVARQLLYLRVLSRPPTAGELAAGVAMLSGGDRRARPKT